MRLALAMSVVGVAGFMACNDESTPGATDTTVTDTTVTDTTVTDTTVTDTTTATTTATDSTATDSTTTTPTDTATTDSTATETTGETVEPDLGEGLCPGVAKCVSGCTTQACANACVTGADSQAEGQAFVDFFKCLQDNSCLPASETPTDADIKAYYECQRTKCIDPYMTCFGGTEYGTGTCASVGGCLQSCDEGDFTCPRNCYAKATEENAKTFTDLNFCVLAQCYKDGQTNAEFAACAQQAQQQQPCSLIYTSCLGNVGGAPEGAGGGGSAGDAEQSAFRAAMKARAFFGHAGQ